MKSRRIGEPRGSCALAVVVIVCCAMTRHASAAFQDGVERFNGTTKDLVTWEEMAVFSGSYVSQNDALFMHAPYVADRTTRQLKLGIGQTVRAEVTMHSSEPGGYDGMAELCLTTNSGGTSQHLHDDSGVIKIGLHSYFGGINASTTKFGDGSGNWVAENLQGFYNTTYVFQITRTSLNSAAFAAWELNGPLLGTSSLNFTGIPADLYVGLRAQSADVTFDNVTVPEPGGFMLMGLVASLAVRRRR